MSEAEPRANLWRTTHATDIEFITSGTEHSVNRFGDVVLKDNIYLLRKYLNRVIGREGIEQYVEERKQRHKKLVTHLGENSVVPESVESRQIILTESDWKTYNIKQPWPSNDEYEIAYTATLIQPRLPELVNPEYHRIVSIGDDKYAEQRLLQEPDAWPSYKAHTLKHIFGLQPDTQSSALSPRWASETIRTLKDEGKMALVRPLATRSITYSKDTGEELDFIGKFNAYVFDDCSPEAYRRTRETSFWFNPDLGRFKVVDVLAPAGGTVIKELPSLLLRLNSDPMPDFTPQEASKILNGTNYVRTVNYLAEKSGALPRLKLFKEEVNWRSDIFERFYRILAA